MEFIDENYGLKERKQEGGEQAGHTPSAYRCERDLCIFIQ